MGTWIIKMKLTANEEPEELHFSCRINERVENIAQKNRKREGGREGERERGQEALSFPQGINESQCLLN